MHRSLSKSFRREGKSRGRGRPSLLSPDAHPPSLALPLRTQLPCESQLHEIVQHDTSTPHNPPRPPPRPAAASLETARSQDGQAALEQAGQRGPPRQDRQGLPNVSLALPPGSSRREGGRVRALTEDASSGARRRRREGRSARRSGWDASGWLWGGHWKCTMRWIVVRSDAGTVTTPSLIPTTAADSLLVSLCSIRPILTATRIPTMHCTMPSPPAATRSRCRQTRCSTS